MKKFLNTLQPKRLIIITLILYTLLFPFFIHGDIVVSAKHGMNLWETIVRGCVTQFYEFNKDALILGRISSKISAMYEYPQYIIFAIWNFPLWLIEHFAQINVFDSIWAILWMKSMLIPFSIAVCLIMKSICNTMGLTSESANECVALFLASPIFFFSIVYFGQYDIVEITFILLALNCYLKNNIKGFIIWSMIAMPFKLFTLFIFAPLILLKEKNIIKLFIYFCITILPIIVFRIIIPFAPGTSSGLGFIGYTLQNTISCFYSEMPIFYALILLFLMILYFTYPIPESDDINRTIFICYLSMFIFFLSCRSHPQWILLLLPFMCLCIVKYGKYKKHLMLLYMALNIGTVIAQIQEYKWEYSTMLIEPLIVPIIKGSRLNETKFLIDSFTRRGIPETMVSGIGASIFVVCGCLFAYLSYCFCKNKEIKLLPIKYEWLFALLTELAGVSIYVLVVLLYFF